METLHKDPLTAVGSFLDCKSVCLFQSSNHKLNNDLTDVRTANIKLWEVAIQFADKRVCEDWLAEYRAGARPHETVFSIKVAHTRVAAMNALVTLGCLTRVPRRFTQERDRARDVITTRQFAANLPQVRP